MCIRDRFAISVGNGTDALFLALKAMNIGKNDEVITVSNSAIPTVSAIKSTGAKAVFIDIGNDFLICLTREEPDGISELASQMCERRTGIGADGLILGLPGSNGADLSMVLHNSDGSFAEMSGNGIRCLAQAYAMANKTGPVSLEVDTAGGRRRVAIDGDGPKSQITVGMGAVGSGPGVHDEIGADLRDSIFYPI